MVIKGGYVRTGNDPTIVDKELFTHIYYAFINPDNSTFKFNLDPTEVNKLRDFNHTVHMMNVMAPARILFSVGGWSDDSKINNMFSRMASDPSSRRDFIWACFNLARECNFDGIDLDWEYPQTPADIENMSRLLDEWAEAVQLEVRGKCKRPLLLTAAVYQSNEINLDNGTKLAYPSASLGKNLAWINVMTYDYHGWDKTKTGAHSALNDPNGRSTSKGLDSWIKSGIPKDKLMMGLPLYGKTWKLEDRKSQGIGATAVGVGPGYNGEMTYADIMQFNDKNKATVVHDWEGVSVYSVAGDSWIGYDDEETVRVKVKYAKELGIGGYFFWALHGDNDMKISKTASETWPA